MDIFALLTKINWLSVLLATILSFILGGLWHSKIMFGEAWKQELKYDNENRKANPLQIFGLSAILHLIAVAGLDLFIGQGANVMEGLIKGLAVSILWVLPTIGVTYIFASRSLRLFLIDAGFYVVFFSIAGLILGAF